MKRCFEIKAHIADHCGVLSIHFIGAICVEVFERSHVTSVQDLPDINWSETDRTMMPCSI